MTLNGMGRKKPSALCMSHLWDCLHETGGNLTPQGTTAHHNVAGLSGYGLEGIILKGPQRTLIGHTAVE